MNGVPTDVAYRIANADNTDSAIQLNCYMLDQTEIENNPDMRGDYNVERAISTFNKRIGPLLVVFKEEVREQLIVTNPEDRGFFTKEQSELINGVPFKEGDQDRLKEDVLDISEGEIKYWEKRGMSPDYIYDLASEVWEDFINKKKKVSNTTPFFILILNHLMRQYTNYFLTYKIQHKHPNQ